MKPDEQQEPILYTLRVAPKRDDEPVAMEFQAKKPSGPDVNRYLKEMAKDPSTAMRNIMVVSLTPESKERYQEALQEWPMLYVPLANALGDLIGLNADATIKKS